MSVPGMDFGSASPKKSSSRGGSPRRKAAAREERATEAIAPPVTRYASGGIECPSCHGHDVVVYPYASGWYTKKYNVDGKDRFVNVMLCGGTFVLLIILGVFGEMSVTASLGPAALIQFLLFVIVPLRLGHDETEVRYGTAGVCQHCGYSWTIEE